jgi:hypothetical protein
LPAQQPVLTASLHSLPHQTHEIDMFRTTPTFTATSAAMVAATALLLSSGAALAAGVPVIGLINKTETNPVCM